MNTFAAPVERGIHRRAGYAREALHRYLDGDARAAISTTFVVFLIALSTTATVSAWFAAYAVVLTLLWGAHTAGALRPPLVWALGLCIGCAGAASAPLWMAVAWLAWATYFCAHRWQLALWTVLCATPMLIMAASHFATLSVADTAQVAGALVLMVAGWAIAQSLSQTRRARAEAAFDITELNAVIQTLQQQLLANTAPEAHAVQASTDTQTPLEDLSVSQFVDDVLIVCRADTSIVAANVVAQKMFGALEDELKETRLNDISRLLDEHSRASIEGLVERCLATNATVEIPQGAIMVLPRSKFEFDVTGALTPVPAAASSKSTERTPRKTPEKSSHEIGGETSADTSTEILCALRLRDISGQRDAERMAHFYATHDAFTGLPGLRELHAAVANRRAMPGHHGIAVVDLDRFESIVDNFGYDVASMFARKVASALQFGSEPDDSVFGLGHDVFAVVWTRAQNSGEQVGESLRVAVEALRVRVGGMHQSVSASVGVALLSTPLDPGAALAQATVARTAARQAGGNRVYLYQDGDPRITELGNSAEWKSEVRDAIAENRLRMFLQPIQALNPNLPERAELLLRLVDDTGEIWAPDHFMAAAERHNLMPAIDEWVVNWVVDAMAKRHSELSAFSTCALNVAAQSLTNEAFRLHTLDRLRRSPDIARRICIEVTESTYLGELQELEPFFDALRELGCSLAIDDFGVGFSSYGYLKSLPADIVKIDGSFVTEMMRNPVDRAMVDSINRLAHRLGMHTVAEFVGDAETLESLRTMGVDYAQGAHVGVARQLGEH